MWILQGGKIYFPLENKEKKKKTTKIKIKIKLNLIPKI
jgi:hypothetical protein